jgi:hypothetical protein
VLSNLFMKHGIGNFTSEVIPTFLYRQIWRYTCRLQRGSKLVSLLRAPRAAGARNICVGFADVSIRRECYAQDSRTMCDSDVRDCPSGWSESRGLHELFFSRLKARDRDTIQQLENELK